MQRRVDGYFEFLPDGERSIVLSHNRRRGKDLFVASHLGGSVDVLVNNALYEVKPSNAITVFGESDSDGNYPVAKAAVPKFVKSANGALYEGKIHESDAKTIGVAINHAEKELKNRIQGSSLGKIVTLPLAKATPHMNIKSRPNCGTQVADEFPEITWEIESVIHSISAKERDDAYRHQTELRVTPSVVIGEETVALGGQETGDDKIREALDEQLRAKLGI